MRHARGPLARQALGLGEQDALLARGKPFFYPAYVGVRGWIGVELDAKTDWDELTDLLETAYRKIAPKRLSALLD